MHREIYEQLCEETNEIEAWKGLTKLDEDPRKKAQIENALIELIVKERLPLSKLDSKHFTNLINGNNINHYF